jgi:hypothetical protein
MRRLAMTRRLGIGAAVLVLAGLAIAGAARRADTQAAQAQLVVAIYTPTVEFANSAARLAYVQRLAKALEAATGAKVDGRSFTSLAQLKKAHPDFAIVDAQCYATNPKWELLANAQIGGKNMRAWALYSSVGPDMQGLKGKKLSYVKMGCRDEEFVYHAMLESEVGDAFFGGKVGKPDLAGAVAEVASYKGAQAVLAPVGTQKGLTKVFDTGAVPTPAFVQINTRLPAATVSKVSAAVVGFGGGGAIDGWQPGKQDGYAALRGRMRERLKRPTFATPTPVRVDATDVLLEPASLDQAAFTEIKQHFEVPADRQ